MGSIKKAFDLTGKAALITGGSRGLGLQIAEALGEQGAKIVLSSRKAADLEQAQKHLAGLGIKADWVAADISKDDEVKRLSTSRSQSLDGWISWLTMLGRRGGRRQRITRPKRGTR
jgi:short-subunit dehydrogenase